MKKLALAVLVALSAQAMVAPSSFVAVAFQSIPVAVAAYAANDSIALVSTGLPDYPAVLIGRYAASSPSFAGTRNPAHLRAFPIGTNPATVARYVSSVQARARGVVTVPDGTIIVWYLQ